MEHQCLTWFYLLFEEKYLYYFTLAHFPPLVMLQHPAYIITVKYAA